MAKLAFITASLLICINIIKCSVQVENATFNALYMVMKKDCQEETGIDIKMADQIWVDLKVPNDAKLNCFLKCCFLKLGAMDNTGDVVDDPFQTLIAQYYDSPEDERIYKKCKDIRGSDLCGTAHVLTECIVEGVKQ